MMSREMRSKSTRDSYLEHSPYNGNKHRKSFSSVHSNDDSDIAYRSAPEYLRRLMHTSTSSNGHSVRSLQRTQSASELAPQNNFNRTTIIGNPKYKAQEDYYDEIHSLKKELKFTKDDNNNLRSKIRRLEEDNSRRCKEIDNLYDTNKNGDVRRALASSSTPTTNVVMNLKQRIFKLELQLKQRETTIDEMKNDPRWTKGTELEIQNRALFSEVEKQKLEKLHLIQHDYTASLDEEKKNAIRKLEAEKRELKIENENLKKKVDESEHDGQTSARHRDGSTNKDLLRKIDHLKETCEYYENELEQMKDGLKQIRRERDKYRDKFDNTNEDMQDIKHQRDQYRKKLERLGELSYEHDRPMKINQTGRSSSSLKHDKERSFRRNSSSSEELSKKDSKSNAYIRKSNEHISPRLSSAKLDRHASSTSISRKSPTPFRASSRNMRRADWTSDDEYRVKKFREKHAATVIQRGWRKHNKRHRNSSMNRTKHDNLDGRNSKLGGMKPSETQSPRGSQQKLGSKIDHLGSGTIKNRPLSAGISNESALKLVQASLRGCINRMDMNKTPDLQRTARDDRDIIGTSPRPFGSQYRTRNNLMDNFDQTGSNHRLPTNSRDSSSKFQRSTSPPLDNYRSSSLRLGSTSGSKQNLTDSQNRPGSTNRFSFNDREAPSKLHRSPSPITDTHRSQSPRLSGSKQTLHNDKHHIHPSQRDSMLKLQRSSSPPNDHRSPRPSTSSLRKSPNNSKQFLKKSFNDDDDDVLGF